MLRAYKELRKEIPYPLLEFIIFSCKDGRILFPHSVSAKIAT